MFDRDRYSNENNRDFLGKNFKVGDLVAEGVSCSTSSSRVAIAMVTQIKNGQVYLDDSPRARLYPDRLLILNGQYMYKGDTYSHKDDLKKLKR